MLKIYGFPTFNTSKVLYVAAHVGLPFEYVALDPAKGEHKAPNYLTVHPLGKVPAIDHDGKKLFESGAICRYLSKVSGSTLYPKDTYAQALVDQWMDFYTAHLGRWLGVVFFEKIIRPRMNAGPTDTKALDEAMNFISQQTPVVEETLMKNPFLAGQDLTVADYFGFAYMEVMEMADLSFDKYPKTRAWYEKIKNTDAVKKIQQTYK